MWPTRSTVLIGSQLLVLMLLVGSTVSYFDVPIESDLSETFNDTDSVYYIAGGMPTLLGEFPFMAALGWTDESFKLKFHCGGMLISPNMVLTAAHCVYFNGKIPDAVHVGGHPLTDYGSNNLRYSVVNVSIFPQYDSQQAYYDIALLELDFLSPITPVCLWAEQNLHATNVTAIGYGLTAFAGEGSPELLKVNLTVFPEMVCRPFFKRQRKFRSGLSPAHVCAGDKDGKKDTCQGDSGGPLIVEHESRTFAVGITSSGQACSGFPPAIYTKISSYIDWISKVVSEHGHTLITDCI